MLAIYRGKRVLITGHTGFKGSWLSAWLSKLDAELTGIALAPNTDPNHFDLLDLEINNYFIDIRDYESLRQTMLLANPEIIFHLAAQPLVRDSYERPLYTFETNMMGTAHILEASRELPNLKAIVVITTDKCYENKEWVWGYREIDPMGGHDPYSASKGCAELITASYRNSFFNLDHFGNTHQVLIASARAGNVIGGGDWSKDRLIPDLIKGAIAKQRVPIRKPNATRPWQHVLESLSGYLLLGSKLLAGDKSFADAWNFAPTDEGSATVLSVIKNMQSHWDSIQYDLKEDLSALHEANLLKLDCSKANAILKWRNQWSLDQTLKATTDWYKNYYESGNVLTWEQIERYGAYYSGE